ncbi:MAG: AmmeMemoRadiSam system protein B [Chloroflexi bacterium]|nr:AmmeMemoRadiSam system protein B [Chloroflexota bacterium]
MPVQISNFPRNGYAWCSLLLAVVLMSCAAPHTPTPLPSHSTTPLPISTPVTTSAPTQAATIAIQDIRQPAVAGMFYPADPAELQAMVDHLLQQAKQEPQEPLALIVPHAGYVYSGAVAAAAFKQLEGRKYEAIVVVAGNHYDPDFKRISVWPTGAYSTPLGLVPVDSALAEAIVASDPQHIIADRRSQLAEHSIEVELPFLLQAHGPAPFVPILIGQQSWENCQALSAALAQVLRDKKALIIASTDMSHYPNYEDAMRVDHATLLAITSLDPQAVISNTNHWLSSGIDNLFCTLCGEGAVLTTMLVAQKLGANRATVLQYANSGDSPYGDKDRVVGYGAIMFWKEEATMLMLNEEEKTTLLRIARETLQQYLSKGTIPKYEVRAPALLQQSGAFVTLKRRGQLRGCIGHMTSNQELYRTVQEMAIAAATEDPRFPPVSANELAEIEIEISVLSPLYLVQDVNEIQVGRDGLYIIRGPYAGVLLPQVATEWGWDREEFLREVCLKAGLPPDAWQKGAMLYRFEAQVFGEGG